MQTVTLGIGGREVAVLGFDEAEAQKIMWDACARGDKQTIQFFGEAINWLSRVNGEFLSMNLQAIQIALAKAQSEAGCLGQGR